MDRDIDAEVALRLLDFVDRMADLVGVCDEEGRVLYLNETARKYLGFGDTANLTTADFFGPDIFQWYYDEVRPTLLKTGVWSGDLPIRTQAGELLPMSFSVVAGIAPGGEVTGLVTHGRPRPSQHTTADSQPASATDPALPLDRPALLDWTEHALARAEDGGRVALVHARVRGLRRIVSTRGKFVADGVMRAVGRRLTRTVRASDVVARNGQDAFLLLFENMRDISEVMRNAGVIQEAFEREPIWTASGEEPVSLALGLAINEVGDTAEELIGRAKGAAINAESGPERHIAVADEKDSAVAARCDALRLGVTAGDVRTYVRPMVGAPDGLVVGYEAFPHWSHQTVGTLENHGLHALAERAGVGPAIDLRVLREAAAVVATSPSDGALRVYAPVSDGLLADVYVEQYVWEIADAASVATEQLYLMIEHRLAADRSSTSRDTLRSLRDNGCRLVVTNVDEQSDICALVDEHEIHEMRLATHLVAQSWSDPQVRHRAQRLVTLAHDIGARVIAPGVHTARQFEVACEMGVDLASGDLFGQAVPADSIA